MRICTCISILHLAGSSREREISCTQGFKVVKRMLEILWQKGWPPFTFDEGWWNLQSWAMCQWLLPRLSRNLHALCNSAQCGFKLLLDIVGKWPKAPKLLLKPFLSFFSQRAGRSWQSLLESHWFKWAVGWSGILGLPGLLTTCGRVCKWRSCINGFPNGRGFNDLFMWIPQFVLASAHKLNIVLEADFVTLGHERLSGMIFLHRHFGA